ELLSEPEATVVHPQPLGRGSVAQLIRDTLGDDPEDAFSEACHDATGGNPLYLRAVLGTLAAEATAPTAAACARVREVGPEPVARAVAMRLRRLPRAATELAHGLAIIGRTNGPELPGALARLDRRTAVDAAAALSRAELVAAGPELDFAHPVVRAAVYESIDPVERANGHRRAA